MLTGLIMFVIALAGIILLTFVSENFADAVSRVAEAVFDAVEYRAAVAQAKRAGRVRVRASVGEVGGA